MKVVFIVLAVLGGIWCTGIMGLTLWAGFNFVRNEVNTRFAKKP